MIGKTMNLEFPRNLSLKALAVALALLLWVHVATEKTYEVNLSLPVTAVTLPEGRILSSPPPDSVLVALSAVGKALLRRGWKKSGIHLRLDEARLGRREIDLHPGNITITEAEGVTLQGVISPRQYRFVIDVAEKKTLPVQSKVTVNPAPGFAVSLGEALSPTEVVARGPRSVLQRLTSVATESKTLTDVRSDFDLRLSLDRADNYNVTFIPAEVNYRVSVTTLSEKLLKNIPIVVFNAPEGALQLQPSAVTVLVSGPTNEMFNLGPGDISVSADYSRRDESGRVTLKISVSPRLKIVSVSDSLTSISATSSSANSKTAPPPDGN